MAATKKIEFEICRCTGETIKSVTLKIPKDHDPSLWQGKALAKAGLRQYQCQSCYDDAYHCHWEEVS